MPYKKLTWYKIADSVNNINWQSNQLAVAQVNGKTITLALINDQVVACAHKCPHAGEILANGFIDSTNNIVCALHNYKFNLGNGRNVSGEGYYLKTFVVEQRSTGIFVGLEESGNELAI